MISDQDVEKLKKTFTTKEEFGDLRMEVGELHDKIDSLDVKFDGMIGLLEASLQEHGAGAAHLARHDRQIGALAVATRTVLPD